MTAIKENFTINKKDDEFIFSHVEDIKEKADRLAGESYNQDGSELDSIVGDILDEMFSIDDFFDPGAFVESVCFCKSLRDNKSVWEMLPSCGILASTNPSYKFAFPCSDGYIVARCEYESDCL